MVTPTILPRSVIGCPEPPTTRMRLQRVGVLLAHHVGFTPTTRYRSADPVKVLDDAKAVAAYGISSARSWEYNYLIGLDGTIFEQGGVYRAAHCKYFNGDSAGVLFMNADGDVANTPAQIDSWWWLRGEMMRLGILTGDHEVAPHYRYRNTSCPGLARAQAPGGLWESPTGEGRLGNLIDALTVDPAAAPPPQPEPHPDPTPVTPKGATTMFIFVITNAPGSPVKETWTLVDGTQMSHIVNGHAAEVLTDPDLAIPVKYAENADQTAGMIGSCRTMNACPPEWVGTGWEAAWNASRMSGVT